MSLDRSELRADARRFENWEFNYAAVLGLGAAVDYALALGLDSIRDRIVAPLSRFGPVARIQAQLVSGLFGFPLPMLGLEVPDYSAIAASMAARASSLDQS